MKSSNKRKGGKCQGILRKSSQSWQWCNWDMKRKKKSEEEEKKHRKRGRNSGKGRATDDKFNEAKLMNEKNWIETTKWGRIWRNWWRNLLNRKKIAGLEMQKTIEEEWNLRRNRRKGGKRERERVKRKLRKKVKIILSIVVSQKCRKTSREQMGPSL